MSARRATRYAGCSAPRSATSPVPGSRRTRTPACSRRAADDVGGARLEARQLRVGVQVAADLEELGQRRRDAGAERGEGVSHGRAMLLARRTRPERLATPGSPAPDLLRQ